MHSLYWSVRQSSGETREIRAGLRARSAASLLPISTLLNYPPLFTLLLSLGARAPLPVAEKTRDFIHMDHAYGHRAITQTRKQGPS